MKKIKLTQGKFALVDDEDFEYLSQWKWYFSNGYAVRKINNKDGTWTRFLMHRVVNNTPEGMLTDHADGNRLNNQKKNLRNATRRENTLNRKIFINNTSGTPGVICRKRSGGHVWEAAIKVEGKTLYLGTFVNKGDAISARVGAEKTYFGEFSRKRS